MEYSIDWLSFTVPFSPIAKHNSHLLGVVTETAVQDYLGELTNALLDGQKFAPLRGRAPYAASWGREDGGVRFFASPTLTHVLVECTGTGCATLRKHGKLEKVLALVLSTISRVDLAVDIVTATTPAEFAAERDVERFKSIGDIRSETGETYYVGSMKSERFARVYRYAAPHPRADTLRVEHVFRRQAARVLAREILAVGYAGVVLSVGGVYGWTHYEWQPYLTREANLKVTRMKREEKATVRWLYGQVAAAVEKAVKRGDLDLDDYIAHLRKSARNLTNGL